MQLTHITSYLETLAPLSLQESYDNSGLITGNSEMEVHAALISLDCTPAIVDEAIQKGCNLIISHHPIVFSGLKKINGKNYIEQAIIKAIKHDIAIYAIHTNLDNIHNGVNSKIAERLGLTNTRILQPKKGLLSKISVFVPTEHLETVRENAFEAGAGHIGNYDECSFSTEGKGSFRALEGSNPFTGKIAERHIENEVKLECLVPNWLVGKVVRAIQSVHPYEEVALDVYPIDNEHANVGTGIIGTLSKEMKPLEFLEFVKKQMHTQCIRYTRPHTEYIKKVAVCGGSGSFLLPDAIRSGADVFITADFKYHQFFDANNKIIIADIGHYESEQFTIELINDVLAKKFPTFATHLPELDTNPILYL